MNAENSGLKHENLTGGIIKVFYDVYNELGFGFAESVYKKAMTLALTEAGMHVAAKMPITV